MSKNAIIFFFLLFHGLLQAQDKLPSFGKIDKADLLMKDCSFDPGAEAVQLIDQGEIRISYISGLGWQSECSYRVRIKVLKESAVHRAEVKMRYYTKDRKEDIYKVNGVSYNVDAGGNIVETRLEKQSIYNKEIDTEYSEIAFALPDVKVGTVFEYQYKRIRKSFAYIPPWNFQQDIPVKYSAYNVIIPEYFEFSVQSVKRQEMERKEDKSERDGSWYIMRNIPGLKSEPFSSGRKEYLQKVEFQLSKITAPNYYEEIRTTWPKIINELLEEENFGKAIKKNIRATNDLDIELVKARSVKERTRLIYNYVQKNMQWNGEYGIYSDKGTKDAWDKKNAGITDINFILIRLLRDAGIQAKPLLASTKDNGPINPFYPFLRQFNCVMVYVKDGKDIYIMNAADKYNPYYLIPYDVLYRNALVVDKDADGGIVTLASESKYENHVLVNTMVEADGKITGIATLTSAGYARNVRMSTHKKVKLKEMLERNEGISITVDSLDVKNDDDEMKPLEQSVKFNGTLESSGDYYFLPFGIFSGLGKNPFIDEERIMEIDFDYVKSYVISGTYTLPDNIEVNELPRNKKMLLPDTSILLTRVVQRDNNIISFRFTLDFNVPVYTAESYPYIKEFFKKMYGILDERIVLKKNK